MSAPERIDFDNAKYIEQLEAEIDRLRAVLRSLIRQIEVEL